MTYYQAITVIEAQQLLIQLNISDYPHIKGSDRDKLHRKFFELAYPDKKGENILTTDSLARLFNGR